MFSGHLVHFSPQHVFYDLIGFGIAGIIIEYRGYPHFGLLCGLMAGFISAALLGFEPNLRFYGGLSGLATGATVYLTLWGLQEPPPWRMACQIMLIILAGKLMWELWREQTIFIESAPFVPVPLSHWVGSITAVGLFFCLNAPFNLKRLTNMSLRK